MNALQPKPGSVLIELVKEIPGGPPLLHSMEAEFYGTELAVHPALDGGGYRVTLAYKHLQFAWKDMPVQTQRDARDLARAVHAAFGAYLETRPEPIAPEKLKEMHEWLIEYIHGKR